MKSKYMIIALTAVLLLGFANVGFVKSGKGGVPFQKLQRQIDEMKQQIKDLQQQVANNRELIFDLSELNELVWPDWFRVPLYVFVTSEVFTGDLGGSVGADEKCQAAADIAELPGTYKAWILDSERQGPTDRWTIARERGYMRIDGKLVAFNWVDLTDGELLEPIHIHEHGFTVGGGNLNVWSAVWIDGHDRGAPGIGRCAGENGAWTSADDGLGFTGSSALKDSRWTFNPGTSHHCDEMNRLYCFQQHEINDSMGTGD